MKLLWVNNVFLHPTTRGGQIRTLETLRRLHRTHEIHYAAFDNGDQTGEAIARSAEYCTRAYPVGFRITPRFSPQFFLETASNIITDTPVLIQRRRSAQMRSTLAHLLREHHFDCLVCDFLTPSANIPDIRPWVVFQHNVETMIYRRYAENAADPLRRWYFNMQAERLFCYERNICRNAAHVIAVSETDAALMREQFGATRVSTVPTGVDLQYFAPPPHTPADTDIVFVGSMDWMPNIDGAKYFIAEILPLIRRAKPDCSVTLVGRNPGPSLLKLAAADRLIRVTGTVADVRQYLWRSRISVVPLRVGGGTRLKIYEAMAARLPVVSTTIGAEGLEVRDGEHIRIADSAAAFAAHCIEMLHSEAGRRSIADAGWRLVTERFSWECVARIFEQILAGVPNPIAKPAAAAGTSTS